MISQLRRPWWKILCVILLVYTVVAGFMLDVPIRYPLQETIRNLYFHVPVWFSMILMLLVGLVYSVMYLNTGDSRYDVVASELARSSVIFGILGFLTGMLWGNYTWGSLGSFLFADTKVLGAFIGLLIYLAYFVLRASIEEPVKKARIASVYSIFAYSLLIVFIFVIPRMTDSLHPGNGGNPAFKMYDLDGTMRLVFYPAVLAYFIVGLWLTSVAIRLKFLERKIYDL